jgi:hypothetical protein
MKRIFGLVLTLVILAVVVIGTAPYWTHGSKVVTVTGVTTKRMEHSGKDQDVYLVFTDDQTYRNSDTLYFFKFNSSDVQGKLIQGGRFRIEYYGFRVPVLSKYKNIIKAEKVG